MLRPPRRSSDRGSLAASKNASTQSIRVEGRMPWPRLTMWARPRVSARSRSRVRRRGLFRRAEQDRRVEVSLQRTSRHAAAGLGDRNAPVDRQDIRAGSRHRLEDSSAAVDEEDDRGAPSAAGCRRSPADPPAGPTPGSPGRSSPAHVSKSCTASAPDSIWKESTSPDDVGAGDSGGVEVSRRRAPSSA